MRKPVAGTFSRPLANTRLYFEVKAVEPELPAKLGNVLLAASKASAPFAGDAAPPHREWPYFLEADQLSFDDAHRLLSAYATAVRLQSDVHLKVGPYAVDEQGWFHVIGPVPNVSSTSWGHYGETLSREALRFAEEFAPRLAQFSMRQSFNRMSNALRLYESALALVPSDIALVVFVSVLN